MRAKALWLSLLLCLVALGFYYYREVQPLRCLIKQYTGVPCPGCGSMRAAYALLEGRVGDALRLNALAVVAYLLLAVMLLSSMVDAYRGTDYYRRLFCRSLPLWAILGLVLAVLLYWLVVLLPRGT